jgi:thermopsin
LARPYLLVNNEYGALDPEFAAWNDFQFPVFPGLLLIGTTDYVSVTPPSFSVEYPPWMMGQINASGLPPTNNLQLQFWQTSNVRILGGTVSGWLSADLTGYPEGAVMFWNSSGNLVAGTTFLDQGNAIDLYGGSANTIWGNLFFPALVAAAQPGDVLNYGTYTQAVNESESGDLVYNNYFAVPFPAITPLFDPLSCQINCEPASYEDAWNVSIEPAGAAQTILGTSLTGSIIDTWYQGGNFWTNYGNQSNPYGVLPYNDSGAIHPGGDFVPLVPFTLYDVTFVETGLRSGAVWEIGRAHV